MIPLFLLLIATAGAAEKAVSGASAFPADEQLTYNINWPTGLSLGEASLHTVRRKTESGTSIESEFRLDASVPGFQVLDQYRAIADQDYCSAELDKTYQHGKRRSEDTTTFDAGKQIATRETKGGGKTEIRIPACVKDAVTFVQYVRRELSQGRLPPHQTVLFGAEYRVSVQFAGTQSITVSDKRMEADRLNVTLKGPSTDLTFEAYFAKDAVRTPVLIRVPMQLATFSMELVR
jgi:Protein of unknown function (DUF3108)